MQFNRVSGFAPLLVVAAVCSLSLVAGHEFAYGVNSPSTGDVKDQQESKIGDQLIGYYRMLDADGLTRTVNYNSNPRTGFRATVTREEAPRTDYTGQRSAALLAGIADKDTSYHQQTRAMSGFRYETVHPSGTAALTMPYAAAAAPEYNQFAGESL